MTDKRFIFFDTETTGVPRNYKAPSSDTSNWPRMVQLGWILMDGEGNKLSQKDYIIRPDGYIIPDDAVRIPAGRVQEPVLARRPPVSDRRFRQVPEAVQLMVGAKVRKAL